MSWAITEKSYSQRRACALIGMSPKTYRYEARRSDDAALRARLKALAAERRRFGYRRLKLLLEREGIVVNHKKLYRLYREEGLSVRRRRGRKRARCSRSPRPKAAKRPTSSTTCPGRCEYSWITARCSTAIRATFPCSPRGTTPGSSATNRSCLSTSRG